MFSIAKQSPRPYYEERMGLRAGPDLTPTPTIYNQKEPTEIKHVLIGYVMVVPRHVSSDKHCQPNCAVGGRVSARYAKDSVFGRGGRCVYRQRLSASDIIWLL